MKRVQQLGKTQVVILVTAALLASLAVWFGMSVWDWQRQHALVQDLGSAESWYYERLAGRASQSELETSIKSSRAKQELLKMGTNAWPAVPMLLDTLNSTNLGARVRAAEVLAGIGADQHPSWREYRRRLEGRTKPAEAFRYLLYGQNENGQTYNETCRLFALRGIEAAGPAGRASLPQLMGICRFEADHEIKVAAVRAIGSAGMADTQVIPVLQKLMADHEEWPQVRAAAMLALAEVDPADRALQKHLRDALNDKSAFVRTGAAAALWELGVEANEILPVLMNSATNKLAAVRLASLEVLERMGKKAKPACAAVTHLVLDENESVRAEARVVSEKIE